MSNALLDFELDTGVSLESVGGRVWDMKHQALVPDADRFDRLDDVMYDFGLQPDFSLNDEQKALHEEALNQTEVFQGVPGGVDVPDRIKLWEAPKKILGRFLAYIWQVTGSCVGAGGYNMLDTQQFVEILLGDQQEYRELWWPFTYGRSRYRSGMSSPGEGSSGSGWAKAINQDGIVQMDEGEFPPYRIVQGWRQLDSRTERSWSDGDAQQTLSLMEMAANHTVGKVVRVTSTDHAAELMATGYCFTQASNFGFRNPVVKGNPPIRVATWNGNWSHQTWIDERWKHPEVGVHWRWGNNWGPGAHGSPTGDEPPGGVYISDATFAQIIRTGQVFAFFDYSGHKIRKLLDFLLS